MNENDVRDPSFPVRRPVPPSFTGWLRLWFLLSDPVGRKAYAISGVGLILLKYVVEATVIHALAGLIYSPLDFVNPSITVRGIFLHGAPEWLGLAWVIWTLPFLWIAVGMSVRRAFDAGLSPWHGLWVFVPVVNLFIMVLLAVLPTTSKPASYWHSELERRELYRVNDVSLFLRSALGSIAIGSVYAFAMVLVSIYAFKDYGVALFFGTPFITGVAAGYLFNRDEDNSHAATVGVALAAVMLTGVGLLLFAVEGFVCLIMAAPIMVPLGALGAPLGKLLAQRRRGSRSYLIGALIILPLLSSIETCLPNDTQFCVTSSVDIAAPRERVWQQVIAFPEITEQPEWYFRMGISCPIGARIEGSGVGALRQCIFTTGRFVEPITAWEPPQHLAFDVREQPEPMFELTPYRDIHPPHLQGSFRSICGEFELVNLPNGRTRLIGRTWYRLEIYPHAYWTIWSDWIIHRIHVRVLRHIQRLAELEISELAAS